jgi:hypothetical protein
MSAIAGPSISAIANDLALSRVPLPRVPDIVLAKYRKMFLPQLPV